MNCFDRINRCAFFFFAFHALAEGAHGAATALDLRPSVTADIAISQEPGTTYDLLRVNFLQSNWPFVEGAEVSLLSLSGQVLATSLMHPTAISGGDVSWNGYFRDPSNSFTSLWGTETVEADLTFLTSPSLGAKLVLRTSPTIPGSLDSPPEFQVTSGLQNVANSLFRYQADEIILSNVEVVPEVSGGLLLMMGAIGALSRRRGCALPG